MAGAAFGDILGGSRHERVVFFNTKFSFELGRVRSPKRRVRDDDFIVGLCSNSFRIMVESSFYWQEPYEVPPLQWSTTS